MKHVLSVLVENRPGVLSRVTGLISRRGFNIESLSVGPTEDPTMSRVTAIVKADEVAYEQITKHLHKLISVHKINDLTDEGAIERELVLFKVNAAPERRRPEEAGRWVKVSWGKDVKQSYQTSLDIYAKDRIDLVLDVSAVLSSTQTRVAGLNAKTTADGFALIHLEIFVADSEQLSAVMRRLHQISGVMKVDRPAG